VQQLEGFVCAEPLTYVSSMELFSMSGSITRLPSGKPLAPQELSHRKRSDCLPANLPPIALSRAQAAAYVGLSPSKFDELVRDGRMPKPKRMDARVVWYVADLVRAFEALPDDNPRDDVWDRLDL
jgi:predicted DNA-binding transcriptional regulator AlpA